MTTYRVDSPGVETTWWADEDAAIAEAGRLVRETNARHAVVWLWGDEDSDGPETHSLAPRSDASPVRSVRGPLGRLLGRSEATKEIA